MYYRPLNVRVNRRTQPSVLARGSYILNLFAQVEGHVLPGMLLPLNIVASNDSCWGHKLTQKIQKRLFYCTCSFEVWLFESRSKIVLTKYQRRPYLGCEIYQGGHEIWVSWEPFFYPTIGFRMYVFMYTYQFQHWFQHWFQSSYQKAVCA